MVKYAELELHIVVKIYRYCDVLYLEDHFCV